MAVGLKGPPKLLPVAGIRVGTTAGAVKYPGRDDIALFEIASGASTGAVFTRNAFCAAPVEVARSHLARAMPRYLLVNSGNANAGTGESGLEDAVACCDAVAGLGECAAHRVLPFSTGVIGEPLPVSRITAALPAAFESLTSSGWLAGARAIMTTDTVPKGESVQVTTSSGVHTITGIVKGSGMIRPDMATLLAFVATDAPLDAESVRDSLTSAVDKSFNRITVDGDTSTNDACALVATGLCPGREAVSLGLADRDTFTEALTRLMTTLAQSCVRDAEGATKFITVRVEQGRDAHECLLVAYAVAHSPLVKTAMYACDPNWGRILAAVGRAGVENFDISAVHVYLDEVCIVESGARAADYREEQGQGVLGRGEITVRIVLGRGTHDETVWTSDLSNEYVRINSEYRS